MPAGPSVLYITPNFEDYLSDGLFHGLRTVLGERVVDVPKSDIAYRSYGEERVGRLYGHGFTLYGLLDDPPVDRIRAFDRARAGEFDLVVFADIWRTFGLFTELAPELGKTTVAVLDGADRPEMYPYAGRWWRQPRWWFLPRAHTRAHYFKREVTPATWWFRYFMVVPPAIGARLGTARKVRPIAFSIPEEKIVAAPPEKRKQFVAHIVDPEVAERVDDAGTGYRFNREEDYYADIQASRFGITTRKAGWDCLRHYELAANGCVPCFRDLHAKPTRCAPFGLDETNCVPYTSYDDLVRKLDAIDDAGYARLQQGALAWARANSTRRRAESFLAAVGLAVPGRSLAASVAA